ncbi:dihydrofolate reductase [Demequina sp. NBRC 110052]|uniref:dihydrofolate reductase n=1 Tax=Demequina sp. NBRC 110052 TaxID=1570341 RepID=UPI000A018307|nr:dihydrofolate reductase [Demequina sp. NBRC 110052]
MALKAIWAQARDAAGRPVIGLDGDMPWELPEDLARFQRLTRGGVVVMGRRTWESLPPRYRPLPGRTNIVVTSRDAIDGVPVAPSLDYALQMASALEPDADVWVIGGASLFAEAMGRAEALEVTEIDLEVEGDTYAPSVDPEAWAIADASEPAISEAGLGYRFVTYTPA